MTATGRGLAAAAVVLVALGWAAGWSAAVGLGVASAAALVVAAGFLRYRPELEVHRHLAPERVTVGDDATGELEITNPGDRTSVARSAREQVTGGALEVVIPRLAPGETVAAAYLLPTTRRGIVEVGPLEVRRGDPLGLLRADQTLGGVDQLWVHPRRYVVPALPSQLLRSLEGPDAETAPQGTITFQSLREYVRGDDLRHIHWRSSARQGTLMVRQLVDTSYPDVTVVLDDRRGLYRGDAFEAAIEITASVVLACTRERFPAHLRTAAGHTFDSVGRADPDRFLLDLLAGLDLAASASLIGVLDRLGREGGGSAAVVVTGDAAEADLAPLSLLRRRYPVVVVVLVRPTADELVAVPKVPGVTVMAVHDGPSFAARWRSGARR